MHQFRMIAICIMALFTLNISQAQDPSAADIQTAKTLKKTYEDDHLVALEYKSVFTFKYNKKSKLVEVVSKEDESLISIVPNTRFKNYIFYDDMSSVDNVYLRNAKGKKLTPSLEDEYYNVDGFFYSDARHITFPMKFSATGTTYKFGHEKTTHDIKYYTSNYFHSAYPVKSRTVQYIVPDWLDIELKELNFEGFDIKTTKKYDESKKATIYTFNAKDLTSMSREGGAPGNSYTYPHILLLSKSFTIEGKKNQLFNSAKDLYGWYKKLVKGVGNDKSKVTSIATKLVEGKESDIEKIRSIFYWVQDNIRYIAFEDGLAGFRPDNCQNVYKNKYGDCKGMANLTKEMLNTAGFDARLTWIGTKRIAYDYSMPTMAVDNHMICTVILNGKKYFLDPTEKFSSLEEYAGRIEGRQVMIEDGDDFILDFVPSMKPESNAKVVTNTLSIENDELVGQVNRTYTGESKSYILYQINNRGKDELDEKINNFITNSNKNLSIDNLETSDFSNRDGTLTFDYDITQKNAVSSFGSEVYLDLDTYKEFSNFDFEEDRKVGYMFSYKRSISVITELNIPDGYSISEIPQSFKKETDNYLFNLGFEQKGSKLIYKKVIKIKKELLNKSSLDDWNKTIKDLNTFYSEQVILKKK